MTLGGGLGFRCMAWVNAEDSTVFMTWTRRTDRGAAGDQVREQPAQPVEGLGPARESSSRRPQHPQHGQIRNQAK
jgi:hypothetical protein